jgi:hypothetical protein
MQKTFKDRRQCINKMHPLNHSWCLWGHLPQNSDWSLSSYVKIHTFNTVEDIIALNETLEASDVLIKYCMLFLSREDIEPTYEDPKNRNGGYFSYKVTNKMVIETWKQFTYSIVGETVSKNNSFNNSITGLTISPKKNFCIIKLLMTNCENTNPELVGNKIYGISPIGCRFKRHSEG